MNVHELKMRTYKAAHTHRSHSSNIQSNIQKTEIYIFLILFLIEIEYN